MKIAIVISGEYRTFSICRETMPFLNDLNNDIYFSTWDKSTMKSKHLYINIEEDITVEKIEKDLRRPAKILIESYSTFRETERDSGINMLAMTQCWHRGIEMVKESGIAYDFIYVLRPDFFFDPKIEMKPLSVLFELYDSNTFYCDSDPGVNGVDQMNDFCFFASPYIVYKLISSNLGRMYVDSGIQNWHNFWHLHTSKQVAIATVPLEMHHTILGRPQLRTGCDFETASKYYWEWFYTQIVDHIEHDGIHMSIKNWDKKIILKAVDAVMDMEIEAARVRSLNVP